MHYFFLPATRLPVAVKARLSGRSRSSLYYKRKQPRKDALLLEQVKTAHEMNNFAGYKSIAQTLGVSHRRTYRIMRMHGIRAKSSRRKRGKNQYTSPKTSLPNLLKDMRVWRPDQVWAGDFTHFTWKRRTYYLAVIMDLYTRQIVGWHVASHHSVELVLEALTMAVGKRVRTPVIFHSDHGSEYISETYMTALKKHGITPSYSAKGKPWQNGHVESWNYRFKEELGDLNRFSGFDQVFQELCRRMTFYNTLRVHSALKMSPDAFYDKKMQELEQAKDPSRLRKNSSNEVS
jgi:transposase InsO family protein